MHHAFEEILEEQKRKVLKAIAELKAIRPSVAEDERQRIDGIVGQLEEAVQIDTSLQRARR